VNYFYVLINLLNLSLKQKKQTIKVKKSKNVLRLLLLLFRLGYINGFSIIGYWVIVYHTKFLGRKKDICNVISKPSARVYIKKNSIPHIGIGEFILTTSKGILTAKQAYDLGVGGEVLLFIG